MSPKSGVPPGATEVTGLLQAWRSGKPEAGDELLRRAYRELKAIAASELRRERADHTLQPTALVHEAYLRLIGQQHVDWRDRAHFYGLAATMMRRVLVDHARARAARKRRVEPGLRWTILARAEPSGGPGSPVDLIDLDRALERLAAEYPRPARVVELRYFADLEIAEIAFLLDVSTPTVKRDWQFARAWLAAELEPAAMSGRASLPELYAQALELDGPARAALLADLAAEDPAAAAALARLLTAGAGPSPVDRSPWVELGLTADSAATEEDPPPERIGPYRIVREIGRGGMGRVFLATEEREAYRRTVALKVIDRPGSQVAERLFRSEVRILAALEHPGIARFLDGGKTAEGIWFLALEFIEGEDLIAYAARRALPIPERIDLFRTALEAVRYAHERGVVHRDLKPGHILVDPEGHPRLLDFGIARLIDPETIADSGPDGSATPTATRTELRAFTPAYASPEQFRGERSTTASDVFSLGAILYELIAGKRPFADRTTTRGELERAVLSEDPPPPTRAGAASARPPRAADLDAVCLKALAKVPRARYPDAAALGDDLGRWRSGLPVEARRFGWRELLLRGARRHSVRLGFAAAALVVVAAIIVAADAGRRARRAAEQSRIPAVAEPAPRPFPFSPGGDSPPLEELERRFAAAADNVEAGAELALELDRQGRFGEAGLVIGRLRQIPGKEADPLTDYLDGTVAMSLDQPQRALILFTKARDRALATGRGDLLAQIRAARGRLLTTLGRRAEGTTEMETARLAFESAADWSSLARVLNDLAIEELQLGHLDKGETLLERALAAIDQAGRGDSVVFLLNLASVALQRGRPDLAIPRFEAAEKVLRHSKDRRLGWELTGRAAAEDQLGRGEAATAAVTEAIALLRAGGDETNLALALYQRARSALEAGVLDGIPAALAEIESAARTSGRRTGLGFAEALRGNLAAAQGDLPAARAHLAEGEAVLDQEGAQDWAAEIELDAANLERSSGAAAEAERLAGEVSATLGGNSGNVTVLRAEAIRVRALVRSGKIDHAERRLLAIREAAEATTNVRMRIEFLAARAACAAARGQIDAARADLDEALRFATPSGLARAAAELQRELAALTPPRG